MALGTSTLSDAMDGLGICGQCVGLRPRASSGLVGPAYTVRYRPATKSTDNVGDYIDNVPAGHVVVLANNGQSEATVWGELLTAVAAHRDIAGTVVDGEIRDSGGIRERGYPLFSKFVHMRTGKDRFHAAEFNGAVRLDGVDVLAGDIVVGDEDGVIVIPQGQLQAVSDLAQSIHESELDIARMISTGATLRHAREKAGYHTLQRKVVK